jgi:preprotein translocase subunit SecE
MLIRAHPGMVGLDVVFWGENSSIGRAAVSKTASWGFESLFSRHPVIIKNQTSMLKKIGNFFRGIRTFWSETVTELKKSAWPTWRELKDYTIVVLIAVFILGTFITVADFSLNKWAGFFTSLVR